MTDIAKSGMLQQPGQWLNAPLEKEHAVADIATKPQQLLWGEPRNLRRRLPRRLT